MFRSIFSWFKKGKKSLLADALIETEDPHLQFSYAKNLKKRLLSLITNRQVFLGGSALVIATFIANVLNYVFNAYLGRVLDFNQYALIGLIGSFYSFASIFFGAYSITVNYRSGFLIGKYGDGAGFAFWKYANKMGLYPSIIVTAIWLLLIPFMMNFFHTNNIYLFLFFAFILLIGFSNNINQGFLFSKMMFGSLAVVSMTDPLTKLAATFLLVFLGLKVWTFSAVPLAVLAVFIIEWILIFKFIPREKTKAPLSEIHKYSKKFFSVSLLSGISTIAYFTFDILLAKHFLTATQAGEYALISLVGKMIFFLGNTTSPFIIPLISRYEGAKKNSTHALYVLLGCTALLVFMGFIPFGIFASFTVPLLYGTKALAIVPYLLPYTFGMACYTISNCLVNYYLARKNYLFTIVSSLLILFQVGFIFLFHDSIQSIVNVMCGVLLANLVISLLLHFGLRQIEIIGRHLPHINFNRLNFALTKGK